MLAFVIATRLISHEMSAYFFIDEHIKIFHFDTENIFVNEHIETFNFETKNIFVDEMFHLDTNKNIFDPKITEFFFKKIISLYSLNLMF